MSSEDEEETIITRQLTPRKAVTKSYLSPEKAQGIFDEEINQFLDQLEEEEEDDYGQ